MKIDIEFVRTVAMVRRAKTKVSRAGYRIEARNLSETSSTQDG